MLLKFQPTSFPSQLRDTFYMQSHGSSYVTYRPIMYLVIRYTIPFLGTYFFLSLWVIQIHMVQKLSAWSKKVATVLCHVASKQGLGDSTVVI